MNTEEYLSAIDINKLKENIEQFNTLNLTTATDLEIEKAIINILAVDNKINSPTYFLTIQENQYFCRVRNHYDYLDDFIKTKKFNTFTILLLFNSFSIFDTFFTFLYLSNPNIFCAI